MTSRTQASERNRKWRQLRKAVCERDGSVCQACQQDIPYEHYECGHKVDRCAGGKDELENLAVMCILCNRLKPVHETIEEYEEWTKRGGWKQVYDEALVSYDKLVSEADVMSEDT